MSKRSSADALHAAVRELYAHLDLDTLPHVAVDVVRRLVDCDVAGYTEIDAARGRAVGVLEPREESAKCFSRIALWERHMHQHPLLDHFRRQPYDRPRRISDVVTQAEFESLDIYREYFGPLGYRYQVVTPIPSRSSVVVGIAQNRRRKDFSNADCELLTTLWPHLCQAYENAATVTELRLNAQRNEIVMGRLDRGQIVIDAEGKVVSATPAAERFVGEFLPDDAMTGRALPAALASWAVSQIAAIELLTKEPAHPTPRLINGPEGSLAARLIRDADPEQYLIVLTRTARLESHKPLMSMGLTDREAEVLYWTVEGKSRAETSQILSISERTVQKHLEHVYTKLDAPSRVVAVTKALEWVRW